MAIDYAKLREQTLGSGLDEEAVTVNTRALIDKVLARYSGEWTTLRELIQNAADASATKVTIRFETTPSATVPAPSSTDPAASLRHALLHHTLKRLMVSNNGQPFGENDWSRLKRIAEGNPDETKIGAFGVGFYSVFADCETPFVTSGDQTMAFYWKGNSLFTRRGKVPQDTAHAAQETCFLLDYRSTGSPVPSLLSLCQFLSTSLTFVGLESIELHVDDWCLIKLNKKSAPSTMVSIPADVNPKTKDGLMKITAVEHQNAQIDAVWSNAVVWDRKQVTTETANSDNPQASQSLRSFFSRFTNAANSGLSALSSKAAREEEVFQKTLSENLAATSSASVFLRVSTVKVQTSVPKNLAAELERATKKPPPRQTRISILTSSFDETAASLASSSGIAASRADSIFASVLPSKNGRIFIGFPTAQTTGLLAHISAPSVIPTVERENIDLNARYVRNWNYEMLRVAGIACRVAYTGSMTDIRARLGKAKSIKKEAIESLVPAAVHTLKQYTFQESTPSSQVGQIIEEAFWTCNQKASIDILSTRGVLPSVDVRLASEDLSFVEGIPVVPDQIVEQNSTFLSKLQEFGLLTAITTKDIKKELEAQAITETQLIELLKWAGRKIDRGDLDTAALRTLFDGTVATIEDSSKQYLSPVLLLGGIQTFPTPSKIPADLPMPMDTIPFKFVKGLTKERLESFGWTELQIVPWLRYVVEKDGGALGPDRSITNTPSFAGQILPVLSKSWDALSQSSKATVVELLSPRTVIPTKMGMKKPPQAYFASVKLFDDLATIQGLQGVKEKFLAAIGVRKTVELSVVFERLMPKAGVAQETKWSHVDLIKYLVSVRDDIPPEDIEKLRKTPICPAEMEKNGKTTELYRVCDLFEPKESLRALSLPLLSWPDLFRPTSNEAKFLSFLGLKSYPTVPELVSIIAKAATSNPKLYEVALMYLISNFHANNYIRFPISGVETPFLPVHGQSLPKLATPASCFANEACAVLGFTIVREDLRPHASILGVAQDPAIFQAAERLLRNPPKTRSDAKVMFGYFATRLNDIGPNGNLAERLGESAIVPAKTIKSGNVKMVSPRSCFLGDSQTYGDIFDFVDFGADANAFLLKIGCKHEPNPLELAQMLVREPARLFTVLGPEKYQALLLRLAENAASLKTDKTLWSNMKKMPCLLAIREVAATTKAADEDDLDYEDAIIRETLLASATDIVVADDFTSYALFRNKLISAPQEEKIELFYTSLGTPALSSLVEKNQSMGPMLKDQTGAVRLQSLIVERSRLFLHDHTQDEIRHDARWMERTLQVKVTSSLSLRRTLKTHNISVTEKMTAALHRDSKKDATLYVTAKPDLYEISRAVMSLLLKRPKQQDFLALEMIMESDLRRLKAKGYNVDRILRQKAAEARIAEAERERQLQAEQERIAKEEQDWKLTKAQQQNALPPVPVAGKEAPIEQHKIPGAYDAGPELTDTLPMRPTKKGTFFSNLGKQLGFNANQHEQQKSLLSGDSQIGTSNPQPDVAPGTGHGQQMQPSRLPPKTGQDPHQITPPHQLQHNLMQAVQASRAHGSNTLFSPPNTQEIKEQAAYCDQRPSQDLVFAADSGAGIKIYMSRQTTPEQRTTFLQSNLAAINAFSALLLDIGSVFLLQPQTLHIYYVEETTSIAFNSSGSIFCNLRFFLQLHWAGFGSADGKREAAVYWWVTLCHELAHNLVKEHSSQHEYFTESFVTQYFPRIVAKAGKYGDSQPAQSLI